MHKVTIRHQVISGGFQNLFRLAHSNPTIMSEQAQMQNKRMETLRAVERWIVENDKWLDMTI